MNSEPKKVVVMGGGPAGLTAAYKLCKAGVRSVVLEKGKVVGGLSKTIDHKGYRFDIGGHRFFTKVSAVEEMWREVLPDERDFFRRRRLSRIYYDKKFFLYPLRLSDTLRGLGLRNSLLILLNYLRARLRFKRRPDNWIYIHDPAVKLGQIQNFKNWSAEMAPDRSKTCLGLEYFCFEGDGLWSMPDGELIEFGKSELLKIGMVRASEVEGGSAVRVHKAYPVYDATYRDALRVIREFVGRIGNLQLVGRNGMHKYNNQDHSMLTAMLAVENILGASHDLWQVNADEEYLEESALSEEGGGVSCDLARLASTQPKVPTPVRERAAWS